MMKICAGLCLLPFWEMRAQTAATVREDEFRSRWTAYQVDLRREDLAYTDDKLADMLRVGPIDLRFGVSVGFEYSNENLQGRVQENTASSSLFLAPTVTARYENELGPWTISASYSVGWIFYLEPDYVANGEGGNVSQTASLDLVRTGDRLTFRSASAANYGSGFDIERARQTVRLSLNQTLSAEYQLSEYVRTGASASYGYDTYSDVEGANSVGVGEVEDSGYRLAGGAFLDNFLTDKTALRFELSAGRESRTSGDTVSSDRDYLQGLLRVNYGLTSKLSFTGSAGVGLLEDTAISREDENGLRAVYSLTSNYAPTDKTSASLYVGVEGSASAPELNLTVNWHPRDPFYLSFSAYQQSGISLTSANTNRISRGILMTIRQQFFRSINTSLSAGIEEFEYDDDVSGLLSPEEPYSFLAFSLGWQINDYLSYQMQLRTSSRRDVASASEEEEQQTRFSLSLSLTF